jgi:hypothetical protein
MPLVASISASRRRHIDPQKVLHVFGADHVMAGRVLRSLRGVADAARLNAHFATRIVKNIKYLIKKYLTDKAALFLHFYCINIFYFNWLKILEK